MNTILMIDDEKDFGFFVKSTLELTNKFRVLLATEGKLGVKVARRKNPDLILLDIMMPKMNGFEVLKALKEDPTTASTPIVMLTARDDEESMLKAVEWYAVHYIVKPIEMDYLAVEIETILSALRLRRG